MTEEKKKKIDNLFAILTGVLYLFAMIIYELLFCNAELISNLLRGTEIENVTYHFSGFRIALYVLFLVLFIIFRKYFTKDLIKNNTNKVKKVLVIGYSVLAVIGIFVVTWCIFAKGIPLQRIAMMYNVIILGEICLLYISNNYVKNIIVFTFTIAMIMVVTVDVNNTLDECKHFMSAYNVAIGNFDYRENPKMDKRFYELGMTINYTDTSDLFENDFQEELTTEIDKSDIPRIPADYNPFTYLPSAIGILVAKTFSHNMADIYYTGRLFNLLTFMGLMVWTFKLLPYKKSIFFTVATIPMVFLLSTVYSADMSCIGITFVFIAYCLNLYNREHIGIKQILGLIAMFVLLWIPKSMSYIFVAFIGLILPIKKILKENKKYLPHIAVILLILVGVALSIVMNQNVPDDPRGGNTSKVGQINYLKENPTHAITVVENHLKATLFNFNWLSELSPPLFFDTNAVNIFLLMMIYLLFVALIDTSKNFKMKDKIIFILGFLITFAATSAILYLVYTPVGENKINGYQTRYILPILPLILMTISNQWVQVKKTENLPMMISCVSGIFLMIGIIGNIMVVL